MTVPEDTERRILHNATYVEEALTVLSRKQSLSPDAYRNDREQRAIVEREFQTAIEACLDIAGLVLTATDEQMPETYAGRFRRLEELGIISPETSERCAVLLDFEPSSLTTTVTTSITTSFTTTSKINSSGSFGF